MTVMTDPRTEQVPAEPMPGAEADLVTEDLVEEVSIDGMCGVY
jgi:mycofactocin precursor